MIVNCLPLYEPPPVDQPPQETTTTPSPIPSLSPSLSPSSQSTDVQEPPVEAATAAAAAAATSSNEHTKRMFSLVKARSADGLDTLAAELELHDQDCAESKSEESLVKMTKVTPKNWSRMSTSFSKNMTVMVHSVEDLPSTSEVGERKEVRGKEEEEEESAEGKEEVKGNEQAEGSGQAGESRQAEGREQGGGSEEAGREGSEQAGGSVQAGEGSEQAQGNKEAEESSDSQDERQQALASSLGAKQVPLKQRELLRQTKSLSPLSEGNDLDSDGEPVEGNLTINYLDSSAMSTLKRSSGSVSFFCREQLGGQGTAVAHSVKVTGDIVGEISEENGDEMADPLPIKSSLEVETKNLLSQENAPPSAPPVQPPPQATPTQSLTFAPSVLPDPPSALDIDYVERSGWLNKLSHRKGVFGDKWQKRYFVLHRSWLYYFKKYGVSLLRGGKELE